MYIFFYCEQILITYIFFPDAHISLQIPYSHYSKGLNEGNMIQVVALCELPFGAKLVVTKDLVLENPPIIIKVI